MGVSGVPHLSSVGSEHDHIGGFEQAEEGIALVLFGVVLGIQDTDQGGVGGDVVDDGPGPGRGGEARGEGAPRGPSIEGEFQIIGSGGSTGIPTDVGAAAPV